MRAPAILHAAAGHPPCRRDAHPADGRCYWCAAPVPYACRVQDVISDSFTDQDQALARSSPWLCVACTWAMTGRPPDTLRLWSLAYVEDGRTWPANHPSAPALGAQIHAQNKADPRAFRALLREPPTGRWVCSIADSGQIHTAPFAPVNVGRGRYGVRYERTTIYTTAAQYAELDDAIARLMAAGYTKQDIADQPFPSRLTACGLDLWRREQRVIGPHRGSGLLDLVLFLARKDKETDDGRPETESSDRPGARDDGEREHGQDPADRVVEPREERTRDGGGLVGQLRLDGLDDGPQAPDRRDGDLHGGGGRKDRARRGR
jgi:hypothetical protein